MVWSQAYALGIEEIDDQHKVLVSYIVHLEKALEESDQRQRWLNIHYAIVQLSDFTRIHFAVEEALMRVLGYPDIEPHIAQHRMFVSYVKDLERRAITLEVTAEEVVAFVRDWLLGHINKSDREYAEYFLARYPRVT